MAGDWTDEQNDAIVADYFSMFADDIASRPYNKAEHNRLCPILGSTNQPVNDGVG